MIATLFGGREGGDFFDKSVSRRIKGLPGLGGLQAVTGKVAAAAL